MSESAIQPIEYDDRAFGVDATVIVLVSAAISALSKQLVLMTILVPALILARFVFWALLTRASVRRILAEAIFFAVCVVLGAFNDYNSVVVHRIYDYTVPVFYPHITTVPFWMLLFWGMILRFMAALARCSRLGPPNEPHNRVGLGPWFTERSWLRVAVFLLIIFATRQCIYRLYLDPIFSWLPFACAVVIYPLVFGMDRHDLKLSVSALVIGPIVEVLYIQVGDLHHYHLGWFFGVPVWIMLWWVVAVLVWKDISHRLPRSGCLI